MSERLVYGLDFGTSNSMLAVGRVGESTVDFVEDRTVPQDRPILIPSAVCGLPDGRLVVGRAAQEAMSRHPDGYSIEFKRRFGSAVPELVAGRPLTADALTVEMLRHLRREAELQFPGILVRTAITIPATWEEYKRQLMLDVAERAGFDPTQVTLIEEPLAALDYALADLRVQDDLGRVLIYDFGGGTLDCAVAEPEGRGYRLKSSLGGIPDLGGSDLDYLLLKELLAGSGLSGERGWTLRRDCELVKCGLSVMEVIEYYMGGELVRTRRDRFEELIMPKVERTLAECDRLLEECRLSWDDIAAIIPVGGSSEIPLVGRMLGAHTGRRVLKVRHCLRAVAHGAVLTARRALTGFAGQDHYSADEIRNALGKVRAEKRSAIDYGEHDRLPALRADERRMERLLTTASHVDEGPVTHTRGLVAKALPPLDYRDDVIVGAGFAGPGLTLAFTLAHGLTFGANPHGHLGGHLFHDAGRVDRMATDCDSIVTGGAGRIQLSLPSALEGDRHTDAHLTGLDDTVTALAVRRWLLAAAGLAAGNPAVVLTRIPPSTALAARHGPAREPDATCPMDFPITTLALGDGPILVTAGIHRHIDCWDLKAAAQENSMTAYARLDHGELVSALVLGEFSGLSVLAVGGLDGDVVLRDLETGDTLRSLRGSGEEIHSLALGEVGGLDVVAAGAGRTLILWIATTGEILTVLPVPGPVVSVAFKENLLAAAGRHYIRRWALYKPN